MEAKQAQAAEELRLANRLTVPQEARRRLLALEVPVAAA